jgi:ribosome-binding factor A
MPSPRVLKLADQIKEIVAAMIERRIKDPRLGFVTVTDVRLTGDKQDASVFYTVLGGDADYAATAAALQSATGLIRSQVGKQLGLRFTPTLAFIPDVVPESARQLDEALAAARELDARVAQVAVGASYAGEADPYKHDEPDEDEDVDPGAPELGDDAGPAATDEAERPAR